MFQSTILLIGLCTSTLVYSQDVAIEDVIDDIYYQFSEEDEIPQEDLQEQLMNIAANPIDLNNTNADELGELLFLSD